MRKSILLLLLALLPLLVGCDAFRRLAGRPTSTEIAAMRQELQLRQEAARQARQDSIRKAKADSILRREQAIADSLAAAQGAPKTTPAPAAAYAFQYTIITGSFKESANAETLKKQVREAGYEADVIRYKNMYAVSVCPSDDYAYVKERLEKLRNEPFGGGAWILRTK